LMNAESIGQYMHKNIIGHYDYERIWRQDFKICRIYMTSC
jgi:hypothetical protein